MERLWKILISPKQEFDDMRENDDTSILLPLLTVLVVASVCSMIIVFMTPGEVYMQAMETQAETMDQAGQAEVAQTIRDGMDNEPGLLTMARIAAAGGALIGTPIAIVIGLLILGTFYMIVGKIVGADETWGDWFGFSCWVSIPVAVGAILSVVLVAIGGLGWADGLAVLGWFGMNAPWAAAITIPSLWTLYLTVNGLDSWLSKGAAVSIIVALIPLVCLMLLGSVAANFGPMMGSMGQG